MNRKQTHDGSKSGGGRDGNNNPKGGGGGGEQLMDLFTTELGLMSGNLKMMSLMNMDVSPYRDTSPSITS